MSVCMSDIEKYKKTLQCFNWVVKSLKNISSVPSKENVQNIVKDQCLYFQSTVD